MIDKIVFQCSNSDCKKTLRADVDLAGRRVRCACGTVLRVPAAETVAGTAPMIIDAGDAPRANKGTEIDSESVGESKTESPLPWPIVRVRALKRLLGSRFEVVRLVPEGISFLKTYGAVTEEILTSDFSSTEDKPSGFGGEIEGAPWTQVPKDEIQSVTVRRVGYLGAESLWSRFKVKSTNGTYEFRVPDRESPHFLRALRQIAGARFDERAKRGISRGEIGLLGLCIVFGLLATVPLFFANILAAAVCWTLAAIFAVLCFLALKRERRRSEFALETAPKRRRVRRGTGRRPFRSPTLGWGLKLIGLGYILFMLFSGTTTRLVAQIDSKQAGNLALLNFLIYLPGIAALAIGYRLCLRVFDPDRRHDDPRPPVVFLRAFDDDGKMTFQPTKWLTAFHGIYRYRDILNKWFVFAIHPVKLTKMFLNADTYTSEELLGAAFRRCGPFVAIGRPGDLLATPGADRMYVRDDDWQRVVLEYLELSQAVVLQPARTDGVHWEMEKVFSRVPRNRILLSMLNFKDHPNLYEEFRTWLKAEHAIDLPLSLPFQQEPVLVYFEKDGTPRLQPVCYRSPLVWSFVGNAVDMNRTFRSFIQGLSGGSRELPLQPKPHRGHAGVSVALLGVAWFAALFILGFLSQIVGYQATVASDIARDRIREVVPDAAPIQSTNYRGRAFPYEFTLDSEWKPTAIPPGADRTEYLFEFRGGLGKLEIMSNAGIKLIDLHLDSFPSGVRESIETAVRKEVPTATIKLVGSRWVTINGIDWREVRLEQHYSPTASEMKRLLFYSRPSGWVTVTILMPNQTHYEKIIDDIVATIRLSADDQDRLLRESRTGAPVVYRGKHIKYELPLSAIWKTEDMEKKLEEMGEAGQKLKAMDSGREYTFELAGGKLAALDVEVGDQRFVPAEFRKFVDEFIENQKNVLKDVFPDLDVRLDGLNLRIFKRTAQEWGEFEAQMTLTKDNETNTMSTIHRVTNREGHLLLMSARIHQNDPVILRLATEALDAIRFDQ